MDAAYQLSGLCLTHLSMKKKRYISPNQLLSQSQNHPLPLRHSFEPIPMNI